MGKPVEVIWDKDDFLHLIDEAKRAGYRQAIADLRDEAAQPAPVAGWQGLYRAADFLESRITGAPKGESA